MVTLDGHVPQYLIHISLSSTPSGYSLRKQPTFGDANTTTGLPAKWSLRNERRNSILITRHYPDLGSASYWLNQFSHAGQPIRSTTQIWVVTRHQYGISTVVSQTSFGRKSSGSVAKCQLFSQANPVGVHNHFSLCYYYYYYYYCCCCYHYYLVW